MKKFKDFISEEKDGNPCWKGYKQLGMKKKGDKEVPNCVPEENELEERSTGQQIKTMVGKFFNKKNYKAAAEYAKKSGKKAADVARMYKGVDARELASMIGEYTELEESAEYQGKKVTLNNPFRLPSGSKKKFGVYVKNDKGNVVMVKFGDPNMEIKRDDPERRKSFRARHGCDTDPGPKWKAKFWSCHQWRAGAKVDN